MLEPYGDVVSTRILRHQVSLICRPLYLGRKLFTIFTQKYFALTLIIIFCPTLYLYAIKPLLFVGINFEGIILETPYDNLTVYKLRFYDGHSPLEVLSPFFVERTTLSQFTAGFTLLPMSKNALYALSMTHNT